MEEMIKIFLKGFFKGAAYTFVSYVVLSYIFEKLIVPWLRDILGKRAYKFAKEKLKPVEINSFSTGYFNYKCHWNTFNDMKVNNSEVYAVIIYNGSISAHFINYDVKGNYFYDITLGSAIHKYEVYMVGEAVLENNFENMDEKLGELKNWMIDRAFSSKILRKLFKIINNTYCIV